ncbi:hypothetical protein [Candidatus Pollutiaquabacter sp.]|uniref:hypothetical protein n=1 Tax=Candidatus Pollutiaquabacter sp. TaxID=3416354 RepID=UPI003D0A7930
MTINSIEKIILKIDKVYDVLVGVEKITKVTSLPVEEYKGIDLVVPKNSGLSIRTEKPRLPVSGSRSTNPERREPEG